MRTAQQGDRAHVHCVIRCRDGSQASSRRRPPLELTVGSCRRLPGLGLALIGMVPGGRKTITLSPEQAYGMSDPARVRRYSRERFAEQATLQIGKRVGLLDARGGVAWSASCKWTARRCSWTPTTAGPARRWSWTLNWSRLPRGAKCRRGPSPGTTGATKAARGSGSRWERASHPVFGVFQPLRPCAWSAASSCRP
jgi:hypothetical protein